MQLVPFVFFVPSFPLWYCSSTMLLLLVERLREKNSSSVVSVYGTMHHVWLHKVYVRIVILGAGCRPATFLLNSFAESDSTVLS